MKKTQFAFSTSPIPLTPDLEPNFAQLEFQLYLKNKNLDQIAHTLEQVLLWPKKKQKSWAKKYAPQIKNELDLFLDEALSILNGAVMNKKLVTDSANYTNTLRMMIEQLGGLLN